MRYERARVVFGCAAVLLSYPEESFASDLAAVVAAVAELPPGRARDGIEQTCRDLSERSPLEAATGYVETFDLRRRRSLHLTYYRHGDTRERGVALASLAGAYRFAGFSLRGGELPDFLPALLELAAVSRDGMALLAEQRGGIEALRDELESEDSRYRGALVAVDAALGQSPRSARDLAQRYRDGGPPSERVGLEPFAPPELIRLGITRR